MSCKNDKSSGIVPNVYVNKQINLNNPLYADLNAAGSHIYINDEGYRGIILYHSFDGSYLAHDRACTYHPDESCASVSVNASNIQIECGSFDHNNEWQECCGSLFDMDGRVLEGPAVYPLKRYYVSQSGSILTISN